MIRHAVRRGLRRLRNRLGRHPVDVWYHPSYRLPLASAMGPPMDPKRADDALTWAVHEGLVELAAVHSPAELSFTDAARVHTDAYLASLDRADVVAHILGTEPERVPVAEILETWRRACGGTLAAAGRVLETGGRAVNLLGGFHHAEPDRGGGFCAINDVSVTIATLRSRGFTAPIVVVDFDAHPPDGIVACSGDDPALVVLSVSTRSAWTVPAAARARVLDWRVPAGAGDAEYLDAVDRVLARWPAPGLVIYLAGADPLAGDRLGGLSTTLEGLAERDRRVFERVGSTPTVVLPAGGYSADAWRAVAHVTAAAAGVDTRVDPAFDPLRDRTRAVARTLSPGQLAGHPDDVLITEEELLGTLGAPGRTETRFLGYYTRHGLEHALQAYGYLPTLHRMGFRGLEIRLTSGGGPDRMRVTAAVGDDPAAVLVDLAASIRVVNGWKLLFVEWLELRDPRVSFTPTRPRLPGQQLPGLGLAEETIQLIVAAAERLELDGVSFVPAHYHVAWISRHRFTVLDPVSRGRFEALVHHTAHLPLAEVTARLGGPGWPTEDGENVRWQPVEMVIPLHAGLAAHLEETQPEADRAREALLDRLV